MSVDKFGRHSRKSSAGARGPPGPGFTFTDSGDFDVGGKRLKNLGDPGDLGDVAVTKSYVDSNTAKKTYVDELYTSLSNVSTKIDHTQRDLGEAFRLLEVEILGKLEAVGKKVDMATTTLPAVVDNKLLPINADITTIKGNYADMQSNIKKISDELDRILGEEGLMNKFKKQLGKLEEKQKKDVSGIKTSISQTDVTVRNMASLITNGVQPPSLPPRKPPLIDSPVNLKQNSGQ